MQNLSARRCGHQESLERDGPRRTAALVIRITNDFAPVSKGIKEGREEPRKEKPGKGAVAEIVLVQSEGVNRLGEVSIGRRGSSLYIGRGRRSGAHVNAHVNVNVNVNVKAS
jgi:hypothetical protein